MHVLQSPKFLRSYKKLHPNQRADANKAIKAIIDQPLIGTLKTGDLSHIRVYKFKMNKQLTLLAYCYQEDQIILTFIALSSHENFYRDLK